MTAGKIILKILTVSATVLIWIFVVFALYRLGGVAYDFGYRVFTEPAMSTEENAKDKLVTVDEDMNAYQIGEALEEKELIKSPLLFVVQLKLSAYSNDIQPGTYTLSTDMTAREMMEVMAATDDSTEETETAD